MSVIRIRVGVAIDTPLSTVFRPLEDAARRARRTVEAEHRAAGKTLGNVYREAPEHAKAANRAIEASTTATASTVKSQARSMGSEMARAAREAERSWGNFAKGLAGQSSWRFVGSAGRGNLSRFAGAALGTAGAIARGAGVDFSVQNLVGKSVAAQKLATDLTNSGYIEGGNGAAGIRQDPAAVLKDVREAADATATSTQSALEGLQAFVGKTGDLETGRTILKDLAKYSRATGTSLDDMVGAAGDVGAALGDTENKGGKILSVMRSIAGQGKLGAVEIRDLSKQMAGLSANAGQFGGDEAENIGRLGALAQEARQGGGAKSAASAVTSVQSFVNTFSKGARRKAFAAAGVNIEDAKGMLLSPEEIIINSLRATKGKKGDMGKLFMDAQARRVTRGFETIYNKAGGGAAGEEAVRTQFGKLNASMSGKDINESFARSMETNEAKAQRFQNEIEKTADRMAGQLLPAVEKLAPVVIDAAGAIGRLAGIAVENPIQAAVALFGASLAKSVAEAAIKKTIESALAANIGGMGGLVIGTAAVAISMAEMVIQERMQKGAEESADEFLQAQQKVRAVERKYQTTGSISPEDEAALAAAQETVQKYLASAGRNQPGETVGGGLMESVMSMFGKGRTAEERGKDAEAAAHEASAQLLARDLSRLISVSERQNSALMSIDSKMSAGGMSVDEGGRTGPDAAPH